MAARFVGGADVQADASIPHGTPEGYDAGCRGIGCPAGLEHGFSCSRAHLLHVSDYTYGRMRKAGKTVSEIAAAFDISKAGRTANAKTPKKTKPTIEEAPVATISDLLPDVADKLTQDAVTAAADAELEKTEAKTARAKKRAPRTTAKTKADRIAEVEDLNLAPAGGRGDAATVSVIIDHTATVAASNATTGTFDATPSKHVDESGPDAPFVPDESWDLAAEPVQSELKAPVAAAGSAWVAAAGALEQMGLALAQFAEALRLTDELHRAERDETLARIDKIEADIKPARAIAAALAGINTSEGEGAA